MQLPADHVRSAEIERPKVRAKRRVAHALVQREPTFALLGLERRRAGGASQI